MVLDAAASKVAEFVVEDSFGTFPTNPTMLGFGGYVNPASIKSQPTLDKFPYLKGADDSNRLQATKTIKVSETHSASLTMRPTAWTILPYVLRASSPSTYAIGDTEYNLSLGTKAGSKYRTLNGCAINKYEVKVERESTAEATLEMLIANAGSFGTSDYVGTGSHAASPSGDPLKFGDFSSITYDDAALSDVDAHLNSITFGVEYPVDPVPDITSTTSSNIGAWSFGQRNIYLTLGLTLDDVDLAADLLGGTGHEFEFTALGKTFTFDEIKWGDNEWEQALAADDVIGMELSASNVDLAIA